MYTSALLDCLQFCSGVLVSNNRLPRVGGVIRAYGTIMSAHRGEVPCAITTAKVHLAVMGVVDR